MVGGHHQALGRPVVTVTVPPVPLWETLVNHHAQGTLATPRHNQGISVAGHRRRRQIPRRSGQQAVVRHCLEDLVEALQWVVLRLEDLVEALQWVVLRLADLVEALQWVVLLPLTMGRRHRHLEK